VELRRTPSDLTEASAVGVGAFGGGGVTLQPPLIVQLTLNNITQMNNDVKRVSRLDQVRALSDPTRLRLLELFKERRLTTKQAAQILGHPPTRLYHHVNLLERLGFIRLVEERQNRGTVEKYFEAVARAFAVDPALFEGDSPRAQKARSLAANMLTTVLDRARMEAADSIAAGFIGADEREAPLVVHVRLTTTEKRIQQVKARMQRCLQDIRKKPAAKMIGETRTYTLLMGCYRVRTEAN
jgi:DNA-binding transcriptional ArsR family regulator